MAADTRRLLVGVGMVASLSACGMLPGGGAAETSRTRPTTTATTPPATSKPTTPEPTTTSVVPTAKPSQVVTDQEAVLAELPGSSSGTACSISGDRNVRSGGIGAGDFVEARRQYKEGGTGAEAATVTLHIIPAHPGAMSGVKVEMTRLRKPVYVFNYSSTTTADVNGVKYYTLRLPVNYPGSWRLIVTAGSDRGCFDVAFNRPD